MANTIRVIEGWDTESWKSVPLALPGAYNDGTTGYGGGKCLRLGSYTIYSLPYLVSPGNPTLNTTWFMASFMFMRQDTASANNAFLQFTTSSSVSSGNISATSCRMGIGCSSTGVLHINSSASAGVAQTVTSFPAWNTWYHIEYRHRYGNATFGNWEVYVNGRLVSSGVADNSGVVNPRYMVLNGGSGGPEMYFDHLIAATSDDATPALLGINEVKSYIPTSTTVNQWVGSDGNSVDNHLLVDDSLAASADYVQATAGTGLYDLYGHAASTSAPLAAQVRAAASMDTIGTDDFSISLRSGATTNNARKPLGVGAAFWFAGDVLQTDPNTGVAWTKADFDASTFGVKS